MYGKRSRVSLELEPKQGTLYIQPSIFESGYGKYDLVVSTGGIETGSPGRINRINVVNLGAKTFESLDLRHKPDNLARHGSTRHLLCNIHSQNNPLWCVR